MHIRQLPELVAEPAIGGVHTPTKAHTDAGEADGMASVSLHCQGVVYVDLYHGCNILTNQTAV